ncbi:MAG: hypothetical protein ABIA63_14020 [bacterium]
MGLIAVTLIGLMLCASDYDFKPEIRKIDSLEQLRLLYIQKIKKSGLLPNNKINEAGRLAHNQAVIDTLFDIEEQINKTKSKLNQYYQDCKEKKIKLSKKVCNKIHSYLESNDSSLSFKSINIRLSSMDGPGDIYEKIIILEDWLDHAEIYLASKQKQLEKLEQEKNMGQTVESTERFMDPDIKDPDLLVKDNFSDIAGLELKIHKVNNEIQEISIEIKKITAQLELFNLEKMKRLTK